MRKSKERQKSEKKHTQAH